MTTYYITTKDGKPLTCGDEREMRRIVQKMANNRGEPIYIGPDGEDAEDEEVTPVRELVLILNRGAWGEGVTAEEHEALCVAAEEWLTAHEGDSLSIRVRPSNLGRDGMGACEGLRVLQGGFAVGPDLRRLEPDLADLTNRAWGYVIDHAGQILGGAK